MPDISFFLFLQVSSFGPPRKKSSPDRPFPLLGWQEGPIEIKNFCVSFNFRLSSSPSGIDINLGKRSEGRRGGLFNLFFPPMPLCHASSREWGRVVDITGWACPTHPTFYPPALLLCIRKKTVFPISQKQKRGSRFLLARTNVRTPVFPPNSASFNSISNPFPPPPLLS